MSAIKSVIGLLSKWQLVLFLAIATSASLAFVSYVLVSNPKPSDSLAPNLKPSNISVAKSQTEKLSPTTLTADSPPSSVSSTVQSQSSNPGESPDQPLQTNLNVNDPSVANNPLVQSVLVGQTP